MEGIQPTYACLSPECSAPTRLINQTTLSSQGHTNCIKWLLHLQQLSSRSIHKQLYNGVQYDVCNHPIQSILNLNHICDWQLQLHYLFERLKAEIDHKFELSKQEAINRLRGLKNVCQMGVNQINNYVMGVMKGNKLSAAQNMPNFYHFSGIKQIRICNEGIEGILSQISQLPQAIIDISYSQGLLEKRKHEAITNYENYMNTQSIANNQKLQILAKLYKLELNRAKFQESSRSYRTNCWICKETIIAGLKANDQMEDNGVTPKQAIAKLLLNHIRQKHNQQMKTMFITKKQRYNVYQINMSNILSEIKLKRNQSLNQLKRIWIIDRQNSGTFQMPDKYYLGNQAEKYQSYYLDVVNKENKNLAKSPFLVAESAKKDSADILIQLLVYELIKETKYEIILVTNDHFGEVLYEILSHIFSNRFRSYKVAEAMKYV